MSKNKLQKLELTWIGKGNEPKLEPRILIEDPDKSYWEGKEKGAVPPWHNNKNKGNQGNQENPINHGSDNCNMLIHGDNLLALKALEQNYTGKIKCIYIDPPYNTGGAFEHYDDFLEHSIWLNLMYQRIQILYNLLDGKNGSSIWVHLDDSEVHYCKIILDEIFRRENFIAHIAYERSGIGGIGQGGTFIKTGEHILVYQKGLMDFKQIFSYEPIELATMKRYNKYIAEYGEKELVEEFISKSNNESVKVYRHIDYKIQSVSFKNYEKLKSEIDSEYSSKFNVLFRTFLIQKENSFQQDIISRMNKDCLYSVDYTPSRGKNAKKPTTLYYVNKELVGWLKEAAILNEDGEVVKQNKLTNIWVHKDIPKADLPNEGGVTFPRGKKPEQLLKRILEMSSNEGDIVLDSFLGSGATIAVAHKLKRKWIGIEIGEQATTHCVPRLKNIISGKDQSGVSKIANWKGGGGFKFYTLAPSLVQKDKYGTEIINPQYNANMLAAAMAKQEGFRYQPDENNYWKQGMSSEKDFIFTTTQFVTVAMLDKLTEELKPGESLLVCCKSFAKGCANRHTNITIKKIPQMLLGRCEFGKDDYSFNIVNLPHDNDESQNLDLEGLQDDLELDRQEKKAVDTKKSKNKNQENQANLFNQGSDN